MPAARRLVAALVGAAVATGLFLVAGPAPAASATQRVSATSQTSNGVGHGAVAAAQAKVVAVAHDHVHLDLPGMLPGLLVAPVVLLLVLATTRTPRLVQVSRPRPVGRGPPRA